MKIEQPAEQEDLSSHQTDSGNAARFVRQHRGQLLHCDGTGWLHYDGTRWRSAGSKVVRLAKSTVARMYQEACKCRDTEEKKKALAWALKSEDEKRIRSMIELAKCELPIGADELDQDPWLLNCLNGTVDLRTGELREHDPGDLITKLAPVSYDPDATSELWESVITHALPDEEVRLFFQELVGYTLTGCTGEDIFALIHGPTRTSKGTVQEAIAAMLGDYAITCELDMLAERDRAGGPRPELTRLRGARMVSIYETSRRTVLSTSLVKTLAGSDPVTARTLYKEPITFKPAAKIWVATNHRPKVPGNDNALWERIREIPFEEAIPEGQRDPTVRSRLREPEHGAAILAWGVQGCIFWQVLGLRQPEVMREAGRAYRAAMDPLARFIEECCNLGSHLWAASSALRKEYEAWCHEQGETPVSGQDFTGKLREVGCEPRTKHNFGGRGWQGISLRGALALVKGAE